MKTTMSSRERILATCAHQPVDHVPLHLEVHPSYLQYDPQVATWRDQFERTDTLLALGVDAMSEVWLPDPSCHPDVRVRTWREERDGQVLLGNCLGVLAHLAIGGAVLQHQLDAIFVDGTIAIGVHPTGFCQQRLGLVWVIWIGGDRWIDPG